MTATPHGSTSGSREIIAYLALGSNLGDRDAILRSAIASLHQTAGMRVEQVSTIIETAPMTGVDVQAQGAYLNAAVKIRTSLSPREMLTACLAIELAHGRDRANQIKWGPRLLDIDVLLYDDAIIDDAGPPRLRVPHPHMHERIFVLQPLAEIAPHALHPQSGLTIQTLYDRLRGVSQPEYPRPIACFTL